MLLRSKDSAIAADLNMNPASFSQAANGKAGRGFTAEQKAELQTRIESKLEEARGVARNDIAKSEEVERWSEHYRLLFSDDEPSTQRDYVQPGGYLPLEAQNYIERDADARIERRILGTSARSHVVVGGPRMGKTSFLMRVQSHCERTGRACVRVDIKPTLDQVRRTAPHGLSTDTLANAVASAISEDPRPIVRHADDRLIVQTLNGRFAEILARPRFADTVLIVDGFNYVAEYAENWADSNLLLSSLISPVRNDSCKLIVADSGLFGASDMVSEWISRAGQTELSQLTEYDLRKLAQATLPEGAAIDQCDWESMWGAFGGCAFLHHAALHKAREALAENGEIPGGELKRQIDAAVLVVLDKVVARNPDAEDASVYRELARFGLRVANYLRFINGAHESQTGSSRAGNQLMRALADPVAGEAISPNYLIRRMLTFTGLAEGVERVPGFVRRLAELELKERSPR
jgi:hypothetical protein